MIINIVTPADQETREQEVCRHEWTDITTHDSLFELFICHKCNAKGQGMQRYSYGDFGGIDDL